jgi:hypothetical protein
MAQMRETIRVQDVRIQNYEAQATTLLANIEKLKADYQELDAASRTATQALHRDRGQLQERVTHLTSQIVNLREPVGQLVTNTAAHAIQRVMLMMTVDMLPLMTGDFKVQFMGKFGRILSRPPFNMDMVTFMEACAGVQHNPEAQIEGGPGIPPDDPPAGGPSGGSAGGVHQ